MIKKLKERIEFRRRRRLEKKLIKYADKYLYSVVDNTKSFTEGELRHIRDMANRCNVDILRIFSSINLEFIIRCPDKLINPKTGK